VNDQETEKSVLYSKVGVRGRQTHRPDVLDIATVRTSAVPIFIESVDALSADHNPDVLVMDLEPHETALQSVDTFTVNWAYYRHFLRQAIPDNPIITSREETDAAIAIFTSTIKSEKTPQNCIIHVDSEGC
jgi:hypothetical protein